MQNRRDFFNSLAGEWDDITTHDSTKIDVILDSIGILAGENILDVGCGTGILVSFLLSRVGDTGRITCIDIAENMIRIARRKYPQENVSFKARDIMALDTNEYRFDRIICYSVFPHLDNKKQCIKMMGTMLNPGGTITICHSQSRDTINDFHRKKSEAVRHDHLPDADTIERYFTHVGIRPVCRIDNKEMFVVTAKYLS